MTVEGRWRAVIAAGGTGGHLFPAQALSQELGRRGWRVWLMTDERANRYGATFPCEEIIEIPAATVSPRRPLAALAGLGRIAAGLLRSWGKLGAIKPGVVIGFGGYPTLPPLAAALLKGIPTCIHEANAVIGRANRMLAARVDVIASAFDNPRLLPEAARGRLRVTGNPVRDAVMAHRAAPYRPPRSGAAFNLLVFGGSQGAKVFSDVVPAAVAALPAEKRACLNVTQQCRDEDLPRVSKAYEAAGVEAEVRPFFADLPERIAAAHLVICRSGASTLSELGVIGRPALLVPLPHSLEGDQRHNAEAFQRAGAGWLIEQDALTPESLCLWLDDMMADAERLSAAAHGAVAFGSPDAVARLADLVESIAAGRPAGHESGGDQAPEGAPQRGLHFEVTP